jgi:hypothetical protein
MGDGAHDLFVSYSGSDGSYAAELNGWLRSQGLFTLALHLYQPFRRGRRSGAGLKRRLLARIKDD